MDGLHYSCGATCTKSHFNSARGLGRSWTLTLSTHPTRNHGAAGEEVGVRDAGRSEPHLGRGPPPHPGSGPCRHADATADARGCENLAAPGPPTWPAGAGLTKRVPPYRGLAGSLRTPSHCRWCRPAPTTAPVSGGRRGVFVELLRGSRGCQTQQEDGRSTDANGSRLSGPPTQSTATLRAVVGCPLRAPEKFWRTRWSARCA